MYWIIGIIVIAAVVFYLPGHKLAKKVRKIQDICSSNYWTFDSYVSTSTDFSLEDQPSNGALKILYESPFGLRSKYLTYHGTKNLDEALDELIQHFEV